MSRLRPSSHSSPRLSAFWLGLLVLAGLALTAWINLPAIARLFDRSSETVATLPATPPFRAGQRVLILAPHPDDETLCCAGMIQQAGGAGAQVYIAWMTAGDGFEFDAALTERILRPGALAMRALGNARVAETQRAATVLGSHANIPSCWAIPTADCSSCLPQITPRLSGRPVRGRARSMSWAH